MNFYEMTFYEIVKLITEQKLSINDLDKLSKNIDPNIRQAIAENLNYNNCKTEEDKQIITKIFNRLAEDEKAFVKDALFSNPNIPIESLEILACDKDSSFLGRSLFISNLFNNFDLFIDDDKRLKIYKKDCPKMFELIKKIKNETDKDKLNNYANINITAIKRAVAMNHWKNLRMK